MSKALINECSRQKINCLQIINVNSQYDSKDSVAVHFGSGRLLPDLIELCSEKRIPLIQGSTNEDSIKAVEEADTSDAFIVNAPNLSLPIVKLAIGIGDFLDGLVDMMSLAIAESHQESKGDKKSGTARLVADKFDIPHEEISSVRDPIIQRNFLGVPKRFLDGHAYHSIMLEGLGASIEIKTKVHGRDTYAQGAIVLAKGLNRMMYTELGEKGVFQIQDLHASVFES